MTTPTPLDEAQIARLVDRFYDKVRADAVLGPVFNPAVDDWDAHKCLLTAFWCSVVLRSETYHGSPMARHRPHPIRAEHFAHWLALWDETAREVLAPDAAATLSAYAQRIGHGLQLGLGLLDGPRIGRALGIPVVGAN